jgi:hypothetical protein
MSVSDLVAAAQPPAPPEPPRDAAPRRRRSPLRFVWDFWAQPIPAEPLALFRVALGVTIFLSAMTGIFPRLVLDLGPDPLIPASALGDWPRESGRFCLLVGPGGVPLLEDWIPPDSDVARNWAWLGDQPWFNYLMFGVWMLAVVAMTTGWRTRLMTFVCWLLACSFHTRLAWLNNGADSLYRLGLFYLIFSRAGAVWSLDAWRQQRRAERLGEAVPAQVLVPAWPVRLLQIQLILMYFFTFLAKVTAGYPEDELRAGNWWAAIRGQDYWNGEAVYWVLNDTTLHRFPYHMVPIPLFVCRVLTWGTLIFEGGFAFFVVWKRTRPALLVIGVLFHLGILLHTEVGWFSQVTLCWYTLFLSAPTAAAVQRWLWRTLLPATSAPG